MSGYSQTPLVKKLGIKPQTSVMFENPPDNYDRLLGELPLDLEFCNQLEPLSLDFLQVFVHSCIELSDQFEELIGAIKMDGQLWVSWPKRSSTLSRDSELTEDFIRGQALAVGLVDVKVCAIDDNWSGLKLVWRKELR